MSSGRILLLYNGYTFWKTNHYKGANRNTRWYCSSRSRDKCAASLLSDGNLILEVKNEHNHTAPKLWLDSKGRYIKYSQPSQRNSKLAFFQSDDIVQCVPTRKGHQILYKGYTYVFKSRLQCGAEQWICSFRQKTEEQLPEWASIYYLKDLAKENQMKCNLCDIIIIADEKSLLLLDHIKDKHKEVFELHKDNPEANVGFRIEFLHLNVMKDDVDPKAEPIILGEVCEATTVPLVKVPEPVTDKDDEINTQYVMHKKKKKRAETTEARKRSWVWKYFDKLSNIIYRCNLCHAVLSIKGCNTNNMNRHVRTRHPHIFRKEIVKRDNSESFDFGSEVETPFAIKTEEIYASDRDLEDMIESTSQKLRRSWIWSYFERVSAAQAQCKLCRRHITHGGNATGNMNRHLKMIHNKTRFEGEDKGDTSWVWKVFEASDDETYICKICQYRCDKYSNEERSVASMLQHLKQEHGVVSGDQIITGTDCDDEN